MQKAKEKLSNVTSAAKENVQVYKAKVDEKAEKASARTPEEKVIAQERRKAKEAKAKMELHSAKADHKAEHLDSKLHHGVNLHKHDPIVGGTTTTTVPVAPATHGRHPVMSAAARGTAAAPGTYPAAPAPGLNHHPPPRKYL